MGTKPAGFAIAVSAFVFMLQFGACGSDRSNAPSEGSADSPLRVGNTPSTYSGTVSTGGDSYYVSTGTAGIWTVAVSNIDGNPDLFIYSDPAYSSLACRSVNADSQSESCTVECTAGCEIYIRIAGGADSGASYNLSIAEETETLTPQDIFRLLNRGNAP